MRCLFFSPVFNQIEELPFFLAELKSTPLPADILLVNNGCTDGSEGRIRESGFPYIELEKNLGVGHAYIRALDWALERNYDLFGTIAANGKMIPAEMSRILEPLISRSADYVTGSRYLPGGESPNLPGFRRASIPIVNQFVRVFTGVRLTDATCGYRALRLDLLRYAKFDWHAQWLYTYGLEYYLYCKVLLDRRLRWKEVPITMRYPEKGRRYTKIKPFVGWYHMLRPWAIARFDGKGFAQELSGHVVLQ